MTRKGLNLGQALKELRPWIAASARKGLAKEGVQSLHLPSHIVGRSVLQM